MFDIIKSKQRTSSQRKKQPHIIVHVGEAIMLLREKIKKHLLKNENYKYHIFTCVSFFFLDPYSTYSQIKKFELFDSTFVKETSNFFITDLITRNISFYTFDCIKKNNSLNDFNTQQGNIVNSFFPSDFKKYIAKLRPTNDSLLYQNSIFYLYKYELLFKDRELHGENAAIYSQFDDSKIENTSVLMNRGVIAVSSENRNNILFIGGFLYTDNVKENILLNFEDYSLIQKYVSFRYYHFLPEISKITRLNKRKYHVIFYSVIKNVNYSLTITPTIDRLLLLSGNVENYDNIELFMEYGITDIN